MDLNRILEKEIDLIQACINRMSKHSFYLKGWVVTLIGIIIALKPKNFFISGLSMILITIAFWYLNAKYLRYEKQYRKLYEWVVEERLKGNSEHLYRLNANDFKDKVESEWKLMIKNTLLIFYLTIIVFIILFIIVMMNTSSNEGIITIVFS